MYFHYADAHKGICIEYKFDFNYLKNQTYLAYGEVNYKEKNKITDLRDLYLLKSKNWDYEKEFRFIRKDNQHILSEGITITGIIFAINTKLEHKRIIYNLLKDNKNITFKEVRKDNKENKIYIKVIDDIENKLSIDDKRDYIKILRDYKLDAKEIIYKVKEKKPNTKIF